MAEACPVCNRNPESVNNRVAECSHVDCPNRPRATGEWGSEMPYWKAWPKIEKAEPLAPLFEKVKD